MQQSPITSPHLSAKQDTGAIMRLVLWASLPGVATLTWFFGWGTVINIIWASFVAIGAEALVLKLRKRPVGFYLRDCSALVTA
ncbi:MAG: RnfABCDGE type electron transport complex subunit D, partial [Pseudomonadales bacterium]